jgi:hypothetical protein
MGLDAHRDCTQVAIGEDGLVRPAGQIATTPEALPRFADGLASSDDVALEATGRYVRDRQLLEGRVVRVVVSNPHTTRAIGHTRAAGPKSFSCRYTTSRDLTRPRGHAGPGGTRRRSIWINCLGLTHAFRWASFGRSQCGYPPPLRGVGPAARVVTSRPESATPDC